MTSATASLNAISVHFSRGSRRTFWKFFSFFTVVRRQRLIVFSIYYTKVVRSLKCVTAGVDPELSNRYQETLRVEGGRKPNRGRLSTSNCRRTDPSAAQIRSAMPTKLNGRLYSSAVFHRTFVD